MISDDKKRLRSYFLEQRRALAPEVRLAADRAIREHLRALPCYQDASAVALYMSDGTEPALDALLKLDPGKRFFLPRYNADAARYEMVEVKDLQNDLVKGRYGLPEPRAELSCADATLCAEMLYCVPAVACDETGTRLGRGGGYYDRLLAGARKPAVAILYRCQLAESALPRETFDRPVGWIVTESGVRQTHSPSTTLIQGKKS